jgi:NAD(P)-dependent dehydrogenase (short-subunit alcohol dehydrogenase family)
MTPDMPAVRKGDHARFLRQDSLCDGWGERHRIGNRPGFRKGRHERDARRYRDGSVGGRRRKPARCRTGCARRHVTCDVTDPASVERAAQATYDAFGNVHVVCNNAGVGGGSGIDAISLDTWRWVLDVNLMGVVHGIHTFLPHIRAHGEGGHIVNTASMAGMTSGLGFSPYGASKFAVVTMSEGLAMQLMPLGIGVTVLCPGFVRTRISESGRNRPERYGPSRPPNPATWAGTLAAHLAERSQSGLDPSDVAARVLTAIIADELYVFTHAGAEWRAELAERFDTILAAMDKAAAGPHRPGPA